MADLDARDVPVDPTSQERLSASGLEYRIVDLSDPARLRGFARADARGFRPQPMSERGSAIRPVV